jgi:hypothetical protein
MKQMIGKMKKMSLDLVISSESRIVTIRELKEAMGGESLVHFVTPDFAACAERAYKQPFRYRIDNAKCLVYIQSFTSIGL